MCLKVHNDKKQISHKRAPPPKKKNKKYECFTTNHIIL